MANSLPASYSMDKSYNCFPLRTGTKQGYLLSPLLFNIVLEVLAIAIRQEKEIRGIQIGKEEVKLSSVDYMLLYIENPKVSTKKLLELINESAKQQDTKLISRNRLHFYMPNMNLKKRENKKTIPFTIASKRIKYLYINLTKDVKDLHLENYNTMKK